VYAWNTVEYKMQCDWVFMPVEEYLCVKESEFVIPPEIAGWRPPVGVLSEEGVKRLSEYTDWFDGGKLVEIARDGIDLMADIPGGAVPPKGVSLWRAGSEEEERYMRDVIIAKGIGANHLREAKGDEVKYLNVFPTFLLLKRPGKYRDVINFKAVLDLTRWGMRNISFNDATPLDRRPSISPGRVKEAFHMLEKMVRDGVERESIRVSKLDIAEAYKHIRIMESKQRQQCFRVHGRTYISLRMQFGTAASASIWCRLINMLEYAFHKLGLGTVSYFDDILLISISPGSAVRGLRLIRAILRCCGLKVNEEKSHTHGSRQCEFLGIEIDLDRWCARVMGKSIEKILARCTELREVCRRLDRPRDPNEVPEEPEVDAMVEDEETLDEVEAFLSDEKENGGHGRGSVKKLAQKIAGGLNFSATVIRCIRPIRSHFHWLSRAGRVWSATATLHYVQMVECLLGSHNWTGMVHLPYEREKQHDTGLATDASDYALGAVAEDAAGNVFYIQERWEDICESYRERHINDKELLAHVIGVQLLMKHVGAEYVAVDTLIDNKAAESWINKLFARLDDEGAEAQRARLEVLMQYAMYQQNKGIVVSTSYIKSELNVIPDALSRYETHMHVMDAYVKQVLGRGRTCTRVRVPKGWQPARA
jgi:hypothetical protein